MRLVELRELPLSPIAGHAGLRPVDVACAAALGKAPVGSIDRGTVIPPGGLLRLVGAMVDAAAMPDAAAAPDGGAPPADEGSTSDAAKMQNAKKWADESRRWRWPAAFGWVLLVIVVSGFTSYSHLGSICRDTVASGRTVHVCGPPSLGVLVLLFIPALLFLLPDLSEMSFLGVSLKRVEDKVDQETGSATAQIAALGAAGLEVRSRLEQQTDTIDELKTGLESNSRSNTESILALSARIRDLENKPADVGGG
jgi:hypothetical protein